MAGAKRVGAYDVLSRIRATRKVILEEDDSFPDCRRCGVRPHSIITRLTRFCDVAL